MAVYPNENREPSVPPENSRERSSFPLGHGRSPARYQTANHLELILAVDRLSIVGPFGVGDRDPKRERNSEPSSSLTLRFAMVRHQFHATRRTASQLVCAICCYRRIARCTIDGVYVHSNRGAFPSIRHELRRERRITY